FVSWQQAVNYCSFQGKRLPTEAEWEKAARWDELVEEAYIYPWGDIYEAGRANTLSAGQGGTSAVGAFSGDRSPYGVLDMAGNVTEWVSDWYFPGYAERGTLNPQGPETQPLINPIKVARGGSFLEFQSYSRAGHRFEFNITSQSERLGFRCVQDIVGAAEPEAPAEPTEEEPVEETPVEESPQDTEAPTATPEP
ncbi:MAG: formylglycine-generating enzyme family protein, partial [Anaerolineae bacterium]